MGCERPNDGGDEGESQTPVRIMLLSDNFRSGDIFLGRMGMTCDEMQGIYSEGGEEEVPWIDNEEESWEGSCLAKFNEFLGFPTEGPEEVIFDFMKKISVSKQKGKGMGAPTLIKFDRELKKLK